MKNSIKTTLSVLLLGLASTAAFAAPAIQAGIDKEPEVQVTSTSTQVIELAGITDIAADEQNNPATEPAQESSDASESESFILKFFKS